MPEEKDELLVEEDFQDTGSSSPKNYLLSLLILINTGLMVFVAYTQFESHKKRISEESVKDIIKAELEEAKKEKESAIASGTAVEEEGVLFPLESFTANLAQSDGPRRFIRLNAVLKFSENSNEEEFKARKPQIRDTVIGLLNSKRPEDLLKRDGKTFLKEEIKSAINAFLINGSVINVYYVGFQINWLPHNPGFRIVASLSQEGT